MRDQRVKTLWKAGFEKKGTRKEVFFSLTGFLFFTEESQAGSGQKWILYHICTT